MTEVPYAADAEQSLSYDELQVLKLQYEKEVEAGHITTQSKFNYAWGLIKSPTRGDQVQGIRLLQEIYGNEPSRRRECLYYLAVGHYKMDEYEKAKQFNTLLLEKEPTNLQAQSLAEQIDEKITREEYIGMGIVAGIAAASAIVVATIIRRATRD